MSSRAVFADLALVSEGSDDYELVAPAPAYQQAPIFLDVSDARFLQMQARYIFMFAIHPEQLPVAESLAEILAVRCDYSNSKECFGATIESYDKDLVKLVLSETIANLQDPQLQWEAIEYLRRSKELSVTELNESGCLLERIFKERSALTGQAIGLCDSLKLPWPKCTLESIQLAEIMTAAELLLGRPLEVQTVRGKFGGIVFDPNLDVRLDDPHLRDTRGQLLDAENIIMRHGESGQYRHLHLTVQVDGGAVNWKLFHDVNGELFAQKGGGQKRELFTVRCLLEDGNRVFLFEPVVATSEKI